MNYEALKGTLKEPYQALKGTLGLHEALEGPLRAFLKGFLKEGPFRDYLKASVAFGWHVKGA